jgi:hypothetical protein
VFRSFLFAISFCSLYSKVNKTNIQLLHKAQIQKEKKERKKTQDKRCLKTVSQSATQYAHICQNTLPINSPHFRGRIEKLSLEAYTTGTNHFFFYTGRRGSTNKDMTSIKIQLHGCYQYFSATTTSTVVCKSYSKTFPFSF